MTFQSPFIPETLWSNNDPSREEVIQVKGRNTVSAAFDDSLQVMKQTPALQKCLYIW